MTDYLYVFWNCNRKLYSLEIFLIKLLTSVDKEGKMFFN